jgi:drug/metabolite transporter (DMT)-like permease
MRIVLCYIGTIIVWSTTPLAFKWSIASGYIPGIICRLLLASVCGALLLLILRRSPPWNDAARRMYLVGGLSLFLTWVSIGWGMRFIPSGWVSVIFGLTPIITSMISAFWHRESPMGMARLGSLLMSVAGLGVIFQHSLSLGPDAAWGIAANVLGTFCYSVTMDWMKRINAGVNAIVTTTASHGVALLMFVTSGLSTGAGIEAEVTLRTLGAIAYLGIVGSIVGYTMFFYLLSHLDTTRIAVISLITPILSVLIGHMFNSEPLNAAIWTGTCMVVLGLLWFEIDSTMARRAVLKATGRDGAKTGGRQAQ